MRRAIFVLIISLSLFPLTAFAQTAQTPVQDEPAAAQPQPKLITAIEVQGNKAISTNTVVSKMKSRIGSPYQENIASDDLKRLYLLGFFSDIKIDTQDYKEGIKLVIKVEERPIIEAISFTGMKRLNMTDEKIKEQLKSKEKQYLDYPALAEDLRVLKKMYEKIGYSKVSIEHKVDIDKTTYKAKIEFAVAEGRKVRIKNILVEGNTAFRDGRILKLMKNKRAWLFNAGILKEDVLKEDVERVKAFYRKNGYTDVLADSKVEAGQKKPYLLYITLTIKEGKKYLVGNIALQGNNDVSEGEILKKLTEAVPGKIFSDEALQRDIMNIQGLYFDRGYIMAQVQENTSVNPYTGRVDITYNIAEKEITYVDKIKIRGNVKTRDVVIRRELRIHPQDRFDGEKLRRSKERLQNLGYFEEIGYDTENTDAPDKKDLIVEVKESKTGSFSFGGGYSTVDAFVGFIEVEQKNFDWKNFPYFTGAGQDLKVRSSFGTLSNSSELSFTNPWVFDYPVSFGFDAYKRAHEREEDVGYGYDEKVTGGDIRLGREISEYLRGDLMYRVDQIDITNITDSASDDLKKEYGQNTISSLRPSLTFDSRDNVFDTRKGDLLSGYLDLAGGALGGDKDYWKFFGRASHYFPLPKNSTLELRGRAGISDTYGDSEEIPIYERFFAGGAYTVRGYEERKIGPYDPSSKDPLGGESEIIGNIEYTYPLLDFIKIATFYDTGNVWAKSSDIGSGGFKSSFGLGFRIKTPIGPIMLDYGIPLNKASGEDDKDSGRFHFSASHGF